MISCPHCHKAIEPDALQCPYCHKTLKAFGHPGIPLHEAPKDHYLCEQCTYHYDDTCTYPQRPYAKTCILYRDRKFPIVDEMGSSALRKNRLRQFQLWCRRHIRLLIFLSLIIISAIITFLRMK